VLFFGSSFQGQSFFLEELKRLNVNPALLTYSPFWTEWDNVDPSLTNYICGLTTPPIPDPTDLYKHPIPRYTPDEIFGTLINISADFYQYHGYKTVDPLSLPYGIFATFLLYQGINTSQSIDPVTLFHFFLFSQMLLFQVVVAKQIKTREWSTSIGRFRWDVLGRQRIELILDQFYEGVRRTTSNVSFSNVLIFRKEEL